MDVGLFLVHVVIGSFFLAHGAQHALGFLGGGGISGTGQYMESVGLRHGRFAAGVAGGSELVGGTLLVLGLATPVAAALLAATMLVAARTRPYCPGRRIFPALGKSPAMRIAPVLWLTARSAK